MRRILLFGLLFSLCICSCSIERRHYRPGFYLEHHGQNSSANPEQPGQTGSVVHQTIREKIEGKILPSLDSLPRIAAPSQFTATSDKKNLRTICETQLRQQVVQKTRLLQGLAPKKRWHEPLPDDVSTALSLSLVMLLVFGSLTVLFMINPAAMLESSDSNALWGIASPMFTMLFIFFAPKLIRDCIHSMRQHRKSSRVMFLGTLAVILCLLCSALSIGTFIFLLMNPQLFLIVAIAAALALLLALLEAIL